MLGIPANEVGANSGAADAPRAKKAVLRDCVARWESIHDHGHWWDEGRHRETPVAKARHDTGRLDVSECV